MGFLVGMAGWLSAAVAGGGAWAQQAVIDGLGSDDPLAFGGLSSGRDGYLGGLDEILRHNPNQKETAAPLQLGDLDKDAPDQFGSFLNQLSVTVVPPGDGGGISRPWDDSGGVAAASTPARAPVPVGPGFSPVERRLGTEGLIVAAEDLLEFREPERKDRGSLRREDTVLRAASPRRDSIYELGLISPTIPSFGDDTTVYRAVPSAIMADRGMSGPAIQVRIAIPDFGSGSFGSATRLQTSGPLPSRPNNRRDFEVTVQPVSLVSWVSSTLGHAMRQPILYVVAMGLVCILMLVGLRRTA